MIVLFLLCIIFSILREEQVLLNLISTSLNVMYIHACIIYMQIHSDVPQIKTTETC